MASLRARLLNLYLRSTVKRRQAHLRVDDPRAVTATRTRLTRLAGRLPAPPAGTTVEALDAGGVAAERVRAPGAGAGRHVLYLHGGAHAVGSARLYRDLAWRLSAACDAQVLCLDHRLAPEHPFPAALEDALAAWRWLGAGGARADACLVAGDSSGGGLALALLLALRDHGEPLPAAAACLSPWSDLTVSGHSVRANARSDPFLHAPLLAPVAALYLDGHDPTDPLASPLLGDLRGLPPLLVHAAAGEILLDDSTRLAARARAAGVEVKLEVHAGVPHAWHVFAPLLPESRAAIGALGDWARARLAGADAPG